MAGCLDTHSEQRARQGGLRAARLLLSIAPPTSAILALALACPQVARLCERLRELGVDAGALLADILAAGEAGEGAGHEDDVDLT